MDVGGVRREWVKAVGKSCGVSTELVELDDSSGCVSRRMGRSAFSILLCWSDLDRTGHRVCCSGPTGSCAVVAEVH